MMDQSLLLSISLLGVLLAAIVLPVGYVLATWRNRFTVGRVLDAWLAQTSNAQARRYRFWARYGRHGSRSRRVWAVGYRKFQRRFRATIPAQAAELADVFLMTCWRTLVSLHRIKRAHRRARKIGYGV